MLNRLTRVWVAAIVKNLLDRREGGLSPVKIIINEFIFPRASTTYGLVWVDRDTGFDIGESVTRRNVVKQSPQKINQKLLDMEVHHATMSINLFSQDIVRRDRQCLARESHDEVFLLWFWQRYKDRWCGCVRIGRFFFRHVVIHNVRFGSELNKLVVSSRSKPQIRINHLEVDRRLEFSSFDDPITD